MALASNDIKILISAVNEASSILVQVQADAKATASEMQRGFDGAESSSRNLIKTLAELAAGMAAFAGVSAGVHDVWNEMNALQAASAQTAAVIRSTGGAAGVTADQVERLAGALEHNTTYTKAQIQSGENMLLTFTNIGGRTIPQATQAVLDMSAAFSAAGKNMSIGDIAIQVGKALEDPIKGMANLRREGIQFTTEQQDVIKKLVETGQGAKAQQMILAELAREFGGSASEATQTFSGQLQRLKNEALTTVAEFMNANVLPALTAFLMLITGEVVPAIKDWIALDLTPMLSAIGDVLASTVLPPLQDFGSFLADHRDLLREFGIGLGIVAAAFGVAAVAGGAFGVVLGIITSPMTLTIAALAAVGVAVYEVMQHWDQLRLQFPQIGAAWDGLRGQVDAFRAWVTGTLLPGLQTVWNQLSSDVSKLTQDLHDHWAEIQQVISVVWTAIAGVFQIVWAEIKGYVEVGMTLIQGIISTVTALIHGDWDGAWNAIKQTGEAIWNDIVDTMRSILGAAEGVAAAIWNNVGQTTATIWNHIVSTVLTGVQAVLGAVAGMAHGIGDALSTIADFKITLPSIGGFGGGTITPFGVLGGAADTLKNWQPSVDPSGHDVTFSPVGAGGGGGTAFGLMGGNVTPGGRGGNLQFGATGQPGSPGSPAGTPLPPGMAGTGAGDFSIPAGGKGGGAGGAASPATDQQDLTKVWKDLNSAAELYQKTLDGIKADQPKVTQALLESEQAMRPALVEAMAQAYVKYRDAANQLAADVAGGASAKTLQLDNANLSDAQTRFNAAAKDVHDLDTQINADTKTLHDARVAEVNNMGKAIEDALKAQAQQQLDIATQQNTDAKQALADGTAAATQAFRDRKQAADDANAEALQGAKDAQAKQYQALKDSLADQNDAAKQAISDREAAQIAAYDADTQRQVAAIQAQIDAPGIKARAELEKKLQNEGAAGKVQLDQMLWEDHVKQLQAQIKTVQEHGKQLDEEAKKQAAADQRTQADHYKDVTQAAADANKAQLQSITDFYKDAKKASDQHFDDLIKAAQDNKTQQDRVLADQLKGAQRHFHDITTASALEGQARVLLEAGDQQAIIQLLNGFNPEWKATGVSLGQQLIDGIKEAGLPEYLATLFGKDGALGAQTAGPAQMTPAFGEAIRVAATAQVGPAVAAATPPAGYPTPSGDALTALQIAQGLLAAGIPRDAIGTMTAILLAENNGSTVVSQNKSLASGFAQITPIFAQQYGLSETDRLSNSPAAIAAQFQAVARGYNETGGIAGWNAQRGFRNGPWDPYFATGNPADGPAIGAGEYYAGAGRGSYQGRLREGNDAAAQAMGGGAPIVVYAFNTQELVREIDLTLKRNGLPGLTK